MKTIDCNLLDAPADIIGHCCNCFCTMGSGVAAAIKAKYPEAYDADCKTKKGDRTKLGTLSLAVVIKTDPTQTVASINTPVPAGIKAVANLYAQYLKQVFLQTNDGIILGYWNKSEQKWVARGIGGWYGLNSDTHVSYWTYWPEGIKS